MTIKTFISSSLNEKHFLLIVYKWNHIARGLHKFDNFFWICLQHEILRSSTRFSFDHALLVYEATLHSNMGNGQFLSGHFPRTDSSLDNFSPVSSRTYSPGQCLPYHNHVNHCIHVYMFMYIFVCMNECMYVYIHVYVGVYVYLDHVCMYVYMCMYTYMCMYVCIHGVYVCIHVYVCMYVCMHVCIYVCTRFSFGGWVVWQTRGETVLVWGEIVQGNLFGGKCPGGKLYYTHRVQALPCALGIYMVTWMSLDGIKSGNFSAISIIISNVNY